MLCASCKREFDPAVPWQQNCLGCWNRNWHGFPSSGELRACILGVVGSNWVCASDLANRSQMASAMWPQIVLMALNGDIEVARWEPEVQQYMQGPPYSDRVYVRRRVAA